MKMVTETYYEFSELDDSAKDRARDHVINWLCETFEPQFVSEDLITDAEEHYGFTLSGKRKEVYWDAYRSTAEFAGYADVGSLTNCGLAKYPSTDPSEVECTGRKLLAAIAAMGTAITDLTVYTSTRNEHECRIEMTLEPDEDSQTVLAHLIDCVHDAHAAHHENTEYVTMSDQIDELWAEQDDNNDDEMILRIGVLADWLEEHNEDVSCIRWALLVLADVKRAVAVYQEIESLGIEYVRDVFHQLGRTASDAYEHQTSSDEEIECALADHFDDACWDEDGRHKGC